MRYIKDVQGGLTPRTCWTAYNRLITSKKLITRVIIASIV